MEEREDEFSYKDFIIASNLETMERLKKVLGEAASPVDAMVEVDADGELSFMMRAAVASGLLISLWNASSRRTRTLAFGEAADGCDNQFLPFLIRLVEQYTDHPMDLEMYETDDELRAGFMGWLEGAIKCRMSP